MERCLATLLASAAVVFAAGKAMAATPADKPAAALRNPCELEHIKDTVTPRDQRWPWILQYVQPSPKGPSDWVEGRLESRLCQIEILRREADSDDASFKDVNQRASEISRLYQARAGRQQVWLDGWSRGVQVGALGALISHGAGKHTQQDWAYAALGFVMIAQINAYQPTKDLFFAGSMGVNVLQTRYETIRAARVRLGQLVGTDPFSDNETSKRSRGGLKEPTTVFSEAAVACRALRVQRADIVTWDHNGADFAAVDAENRRLIKACDALMDAVESAKEVATSPALSDTSLAQLEARDLVFLDDNLVHRDQELRYSPLQTLTAIAAAPFNAATTLLTGDDATTALNGIRVQKAFDKLDYILGRVDAPDVVPGSGDRIVAAAAVDERIYVSPPRPASIDKKKLKKGEKPPVPPTEAQFVNATLNLGDATAKLNRVVPLVRDINKQSQALADFVAANHLTFNYDATTSVITVKVTPPPPPPPAQQSGTSDGVVTPVKTTN